MAGRIRIPPYRPLGVSTQAVPGGGYFDVDASAGSFGPAPLMQLGLQAAEGAAGIATVVSEQLARDNEAVVKGADIRLGETEQVLLFDPRDGYLNTQGEAALTRAPDVLEAYGQAQQREIAALANDEQRRMLEGLAQRRLTTFGEQVERHSAAERLRWHDAASEQRITQMRADAGLHWSDDALLRRALGTTRAEVRDKAERHGWESALTEAALRQQTSRTLVSAIEAAVDRDPERAEALRMRYAAAIEDQDRAELDALLSEAQTRQRAQAASTEILNATPPDGAPSMPQWRLRQAEAITEPVVRAATIRRVLSAASADEAHARALGEQVLERVLKEGLTDPSQIPVREWVTLDAERRQAIETRLDHNAAGTEPDPNPALVDVLATQMTQASYDFVRRDLVPLVADLPMAQWQRFRDWQAGIRRNDRAIDEELYAIKRGLQIAQKMLPADTPDDSATNYRADLVEEIDIWRRRAGKSLNDDAIREMIERGLPAAPVHSIKFLFAPKVDPPLHMIRLPVPKRLERQTLELLQLLWLLLKGVTIGLKTDQDTVPPGWSYAPTPPQPADGRPSTKRMPAPDVPEVRTQKEQFLPPPPLPGGPAPTPEIPEEWKHNAPTRPVDPLRPGLEGPSLDGSNGPTRLETFPPKSVPQILKSQGSDEEDEERKPIAQDIGKNADSETTQELLDHLDVTVDQFIGKFRKGSIRREVSTGYFGLTVRELWRLNDREAKKAKKLLLDRRFRKGAR